MRSSDPNISNQVMHSIQQFASSNRLPSLPEVARKLVEIAHQDEPDFNEISRVIKSDPVVSGKILKTVNSALFGFRPKIESIPEAIPKLGVTLLRTLILSFHLAGQKSEGDANEPVLQKLWRSSLTQAVFAELIAEQVPGADPPSCFLAAMLQDIGILAMVSEAPDEYTEFVLNRAELPNVSAAERSHFGFSHIEVSLEILKQWGLEDCFGTAVIQHHNRIASSSDEKPDRLSPILQAATLGTAVLASNKSSSTSLDSSLDQWIDFLQIHFGLSGMQADELISDVNQLVAEYSVIFQFNIGEDVQVDEVVANAKDLLQEIALKNQLEQMSESISAKNKKSAEDNELYRDSLTGLFNRRFMNKHLNDKLAVCIKKSRPLALLFLDVDKFKAINDNYGHSTGDKAIQHVANWLTKAIRKSDIAIRLGGDEFLVILENVKQDEFERIANRIADEVPPIELEDSERIVVSLSVGCAFYRPKRGDAADANWLIDQADQSMYKAKKAGGDSISVQMFVGENLVSA